MASGFPHDDAATRATRPLRGAYNIFLGFTGFRVPLCTYMALAIWAMGYGVPATQSRYFLISCCKHGATGPGQPTNLFRTPFCCLPDALFSLRPRPSQNVPLFILHAST